MTFPSTIGPLTQRVKHMSPCPSSLAPPCFDAISPLKRPLGGSGSRECLCPSATSTAADMRRGGAPPSSSSSFSSSPEDPRSRYHRGRYVSSSRRLAASLNNIGALSHRAGRATGALESYQQAVRVRMDSLRGAAGADHNNTASVPVPAAAAIPPAAVPPELAEEMVRRSDEARRQERALREAQRSDPAGLDLFDLADGSSSSASANSASQRPVDNDGDVDMDMDMGGSADNTVPEVVYTDPLHIVDSDSDSDSNTAGSDSDSDSDSDYSFAFDQQQENDGDGRDDNDSDGSSHSVADDHRGSAVTLFNMGLVHATNGSLEKAAQLFNMAKSVVKPTAEPALTACVLNNLARVRYQSHDPTEAIRILTRALHLEQAAFADLDTADDTATDDTTTDKNNKKRRQQVVSIEATIIDTLSLMSRLHFAHGDPAKSVELGRETLRIRRSLLGDDHLSVHCTLYNIGLALQRVGDAEESLRHCAYFASKFTSAAAAAACVDTARLSPTARAQIGTALHNVGVMQLHHDSVTQSVRTLEAALSVRRAALHTAPDELHPDVADSLYQLGQILQNTGRDREAMDTYREAAHIFRRTIGPDHEDVAVVCCAMGQIHQSRGETDEALAVYAEVLRIARLTFGPADGFVAEVLGILGNVHLERGDNDAAMECFSESSRILCPGEEEGGGAGRSGPPGQQRQHPLVVPSLAGFHFHPHAAAA